MREGINGHALPPGSTSDDFAAIIHNYLADIPRYTALRHSTRQEYETHLNWTAWATHSAELIRQAVTNRETQIKA